MAGAALRLDNLIHELIFINAFTTPTIQRMKNSLLIIATLFSLHSFCQAVSGRVQDSTGLPLANATVLLLTAKDSGLLKGALTDANGHYRFDRLPPSRYRLNVSCAGYRQTVTESFTVERTESEQEVPALVLHAVATQLKEVTLSARRPFVEQKTDRTVVNVAGSIIASGITALEVLEKAPGVTVDRQNEQISLRGREGVIVQIDGKQTYLSMGDVVALLRNMPSDNIDRIELLTNPSAKYDASGNAGLIDIRLKKNNNIGTNASISLTGGSGRFAKQRGNLQINHRTTKLNLFGNYSVSKDLGYFDFDITRIQEDGAEQNYISNLSYIRTKNRGLTGKTGLDYFLSKHTTGGVVWTAFWNKAAERSPAEAIFRRTAGGPVYLHTLSEKTIFTPSTNHLVNFNLQHAFAKVGQQLSADFDMGRFRRDYDNTLSTQTLFPFTPGEPLTGLYTTMPTAIDILTFKTDYAQPINQGWKMEAGFKQSAVKSDNNVELLSGEAGHLEKDTAQSNHFRYIEYVTAAYVNFTGTISPKTNVMVGLRAEQTSSDGNSLTLHNRVRRNYLNIFPSLFYTRSLTKKHRLSFSYSYRIDRPNYQRLNPARSYLDAYTYSSGNAFLKPQYTHSFELRHGFNEKVVTSLAASFINDLQFFVIQPMDGKTSRRMPENIGTSQAYSFTLSFPVQVSKGWRLQGTIMGTYSVFDYTYKGEPLHVQQAAGRMNVSNAFTFGKGWAGELMGRLNTPAVNALQQLPWLGSLDAGVQKTFNAKWRAKLSLQDVFHTDRILSHIDVPHFESQTRIAQDTRFCLLNVTYNFGNQQLKGNRQRKTAAEEEVQRTNN